MTNLTSNHLEALCDAAYIAIGKPSGSVLDRDELKAILPECVALMSKHAADMRTPITAEILLANGWRKNRLYRDMIVRDDLPAIWIDTREPELRVWIGQDQMRGVRTMHDLAELCQMVGGGEA